MKKTHTQDLVVVKIAEEPRGTGRPSEFNQETADEICERIAGGESVISICKDEGMPAKSTVMKWLNKFPGFADQYARAGELRGEADADQVNYIGHLVLAGKIKPDAGRVAMDAAKWSAEKRAMKKYGAKVEVEHSGRIGLESLVAGDPEPK